VHPPCLSTDSSKRALHHWSKFSKFSISLAININSTSRIYNIGFYFAEVYNCVYIIRILAAMVQEAPYRIIRVSSKSPTRILCRMEQLDIGGSMGTVPRQESVSTCHMRHRELLTWHCWFARFSARARARRVGKIKI
jgi:hypothetical protein